MSDSPEKPPQDPHGELLARLRKLREEQQKIALQMKAARQRREQLEARMKKEPESESSS
jgi:predicted transcriptional regulator